MWLKGSANYRDSFKKAISNAQFPGRYKLKIRLIDSISTHCIPNSTQGRIKHILSNNGETTVLVFALQQPERTLLFELSNAKNTIKATIESPKGQIYTVTSQSTEIQQLESLRIIEVVTFTLRSDISPQVVTFEGSLSWNVRHLTLNLGYRYVQYSP